MTDPVSSIALFIEDHTQSSSPAILDTNINRAVYTERVNKIVGELILVRGCGWFAIVSHGDLLYLRR